MIGQTIAPYRIVGKLGGDGVRFAVQLAEKILRITDKTFPLSAAAEDSVSLVV